MSIPRREPAAAASIRQVPATPRPPWEVVLPRLQTLTTALTTAGMTATIKYPDGAEPYIQVINPAATDLRDRITCRHHLVDGSALWFVHSWGDPIGPAWDVGAAVADIRAWLQPRPGAGRAQP